VELRSVEPVVTGTARGDVRAHLCNAGPDGTLSAGRLEGLARRCAEVEIAGSHFDPSPTNGYQYLVVSVIPRTLGTIVVEGVRIHYVDGAQRGTQRASGQRAEVTIS